MALVQRAYSALIKLSVSNFRVPFFNHSHLLQTFLSQFGIQTDHTLLSSPQLLQQQAIALWTLSHSSLIPESLSWLFLWYIVHCHQFSCPLISLVNLALFHCKNTAAYLRGNIAHIFIPLITLPSINLDYKTLQTHLVYSLPIFYFISICQNWSFCSISR